MSASSSLSAQDLICAFEEEQKNAVFSSLSEYLHLSLFADVVLVCGSAQGRKEGERRIRAHRVVLAASAKFFRDLFRRDPGLQEVDLDRELAQNDLLLSFEDVRLIVGVLYCVGTVEISPPRIKVLTLASQVLGIPTLTRFLRRIDNSISQPLQQHFHHGQQNFPPPPLAQPALPSSSSGSVAAVYSSGSQFPLGVGRHHQPPRDKVLSIACASYVYSAHQSTSHQQPEQPRVFQDVTATEFAASRKQEPPSESRPPSTPDSLTRPAAPRPLPAATPPSRSQSRNTLASIGSFSLQPLASPIPRDAVGATASAPTSGDKPSGSFPHPSRVVSSVLESFDPSFFNNLPANQIDDLENVLLPHLQQQDECPPANPPPLPPPATAATSAGSNTDQDPTVRQFDPDRSPDVTGPTSQAATSVGEKTTAAGTSEARSRSSDPLNLSGHAEEGRSRQECVGDFSDTGMTPRIFTRLLPSGKQDLSADPVQLKPGALPRSVIVEHNPSAAASRDRCKEKAVGGPEADNVEEPSSDTSDASYNEAGEEADEEDEEEGEAAETTKKSRKDAGSSSKVDDVDQGKTAAVEGKDEISMSLEDDDVEGKSFKFAIPGSSKFVSLNFSADALLEMRNTVKKSVSSSPSSSSSPVAKRNQRNRKKNVVARRASSSKEDKKKLDFHCPHSDCSKAYHSKELLEKHMAFHVDSSSVSCGVCGEMFLKRWSLDQHLAVDHGREAPLSCEECGMEFRWRRNLLAHVQLHHQKERRYRCKYCPLTFLQRRSYINHQRSKHPKQPPTWCQACLEIFSNSKQREDHSCGGVEVSGSGAFVCRLHHRKPVSFSRQGDLDEHLRRAHGDGVASLQISCPVCHKKFLLRKNLSVHMRRFHDEAASDSGGAVQRRPGDTDNADPVSTASARKHPCSFCGKKFLYLSDRLEHENTHTGDRAHRCDEPDCRKRYSSAKALSFHKKHSHRDGAVYECSICNKQLSNRYKLKYHMKVHTDRGCYRCAFCSIEFKSRDNVSRHVRKFHKKEEIPDADGREVEEGRKERVGVEDNSAAATTSPPVVVEAKRIRQEEDEESR